MQIRVQEEIFDPGEEVNAFSRSLQGAGAMVSFTGIVRDRPEGGLDALEIEHYPGMTESALTEIAAEAMERWALTDALIVHRFGRLQLGEPIMMVATAAPHRGDAFASAEFLMDYLKSRAPFWKKEFVATGEAWVEARAEDEEALERWQGES
ncbi:molybdenum cofactor biosynthesis protein MoaE [Chachezhania sediminis]|uniref:molybdenum cofactor biosynthesis protein MoaE n=1 Tax=Chachezhania sediminis TaxID=2599291 RepID=UPI00131D7E6A|nr:molybdenum cofactor biosynthesis protein MoaE [Chachezhania sediminis]